MNVKDKQGFFLDQIHKELQNLLLKPKYLWNGYSQRQIMVFVKMHTTTAIVPLNVEYLYSCETH